jgi:glycosyltransferase involved in cell wall biosynthesis
MTDLRIILVANYLADDQRSMLRFARLLHSELGSRGVEVATWHPPTVIGGRGQSAGTRHKWLGYADKFLLYPPRLGRAIRREAPSRTVVHVCDHSNAVYVPWIRDVPHVVTCHDLIAVRAALGEFPGQQTPWTGRRLQQAVRRGLQTAARIVCDSEATRQDVRRLVRSSAGESVIFPGVTPTFRPMARADADFRVDRLRLPRPFLLHVGGSQWYKNRAGLLDLYAALSTRLPAAPSLVLVGKPLTRSEREALAARGVPDRVVTVSRVADDDLAALYAGAEALLFPSLVEGFGWPVLEAMACGGRVIASDRAPMTEVGGDAITYIDPQNPLLAASIVEAVLREPAGDRNAKIAAGLARATRHSSGAMADAYLSVYRDALARPHAA